MTPQRARALLRATICQLAVMHSPRLVLIAAAVSDRSRQPLGLVEMVAAQPTSRGPMMTSGLLGWSMRRWPQPWKRLPAYWQTDYSPIHRCRMSGRRRRPVGDANG